MKHLSVDEIIRFVSMTELNDEARTLSATVNGHICKCKKCLKLVNAYQTIYDELSKLAISGDFGSYSEKHLLNVDPEKTIAVEAELDDFDVYR